MKLFLAEFGTAGVGDTSGAFQVDNICEVQITIIGDYSSQTVTMQVSADRSTYGDFYPDGTIATFTISNEQRFFRLQPGYYRFVCGGAGTPDLDVYVDGRYVSF